MSVYDVPDMAVKMSNLSMFSMLSNVIAVHLQYKSRSRFNRTADHTLPVRSTIAARLRSQETGTAGDAGLLVA